MEAEVLPVLQLALWTIDSSPCIDSFLASVSGFRAFGTQETKRHEHASNPEHKTARHKA